LTYFLKAFYTTPEYYVTSGKGFTLLVNMQ